MQEIVSQSIVITDKNVSPVNNIILEEHKRLVRRQVPAVRLLDVEMKTR